MRKPILYLLSTIVVVFYGAVAGAAVSPYYGAVTEFIHSATSSVAIARLLAPPTPSGATSPSGRTSSGGAHQVAAALAATATPMPTTVPATPTPTTQQKLAVKVSHLAAHAVLPHQRINILLLGSDNDAKFAAGVIPPTQVMMVVSIDPVSRTITLFSIPRDSWVHIPGYTYNVGPDGTTGWSKIQIASTLGFNSAMCTVEKNFGIPIDNYVWVGLKGFIQVINSMNGVTVDVTHPVLDDTYPDDLNPNDPYAYRRLFIPPGPQHLNGSTALLFVRSRHGDIKSDFGRSERQQIVLTQLRRSLMSRDAASLVALLPTLLEDMKGNVQTDISPDLATVAKYWSLLRSAAHYTLRQVVLTPPYTDEVYVVQDSDPSIEKLNGGQPLNEDAVKLHWDQINPLVASIFGGQDYSAPHCAGIPGA